MSPQTRSTKQAEKAAKLRERLESLKRSILSTGPIVQGSILKRTISREDPLRPGKTKAYGPYYQWTRKIAGRTVIQNLTRERALAFTQAIRENNRLERLLAQMRDVSLKFLELTTPGVAKRKREKAGKKRLS